MSPTAWAASAVLPTCCSRSWSCSSCRFWWWFRLAWWTWSPLWLVLERLHLRLIRQKLKRNESGQKYNFISQIQKVLGLPKLQLRGWFWQHFQAVSYRWVWRNGLRLWLKMPWPMPRSRQRRSLQKALAVADHTEILDFVPVFARDDAIIPLELITTSKYIHTTWHIWLWLYLLMKDLTTGVLHHPERRWCNWHVLVNSAWWLNYLLDPFGNCSIYSYFDLGVICCPLWMI